MPATVVDDVAAFFGTTPETVYAERNTFFALLACGVSRNLGHARRARWIRCLFGLGAKCTAQQAAHVAKFYACSLAPYSHFSPALRNVYLSQPQELSFLLHLLVPPVAPHNEQLKWERHLLATYCLRTRNLARLYVTPWHPQTYLDNGKRARETALVVLFCGRRSNLPDAVCRQLWFYLSLLRHNRQ
jgi:hypothetical protein